MTTQKAISIASSLNLHRSASKLESTAKAESRKYAEVERVFGDQMTTTSLDIAYLEWVFRAN